MSRLCRAEYLSRAYELAPRGEQLPQAKLNADLVRQIRANVNGLTAEQWAERLGVKPRTISAVREYQNWRHV